MEVGLVKKVDIDQEMQQSYLDFAMSVIVARALPDARDGLKPVQRRILYAMYDMGLRPDSAYKKSARIVGEVLGKYHPHGDMAVYEAMARLAQDFSMRYPLVDGQGNFGSVDGDPPAAMRYTEARLKSFAIELLNQIDRSTVDFASNFDDSLQEPLVLPAAVPNLLVSGSTGIAVGMATSIPPHNLGEVVDALLFMLQQWDKLDDINVSDLMRYIQGPDFPTGGVILQDQNSDLLTAYATGKGRLTVRGQVHMEDTGRGRSRLIITELPYMTNKASLIERVAELVREGHLEGISDLRDESDRQGMRIVIELSKVGEPENVLRDLYRRTPLESTFGITLLALVDGEPRLLTLKQALRVYLEHRIVVVRRRSEYDLARAKARAHLLEGLRIAIENLDEVIKVIRAAADVDQARERLIKRFKLSEIQAQAILDMPLRRLAALERKKIDQEYKELQTQIKELETLLKSAKRMREVVGTELLAMKQTYGDRRRTRIVSLREGETARMLLTTTDLTSAEAVWVGITANGLIARTRGDEAPQGSAEQSPRWLLRTNTHHTLYLVGQSGQAAAVAVHTLPIADQLADGVPVSKASSLAESERLAGVFSVPARNGHPLADAYIVTLSEQGLIKKSSVADLPGPSSQRFTLARVNADDRLIALALTNGQAELLLATARGMAIRFVESEVRAMGLVAAGVNAIKLAAGDRVIGLAKFDPSTELLLLGEDGSGWRMRAAEFPLQGRYGQGVIACRPAAPLAGMLLGAPKTPASAILASVAPQSIRLDVIPAGKRAAAARKALAVKADNRITALASATDSLDFWDPQPKVDESVKKSRAAKPAAQKTMLPSAEDFAQAEQPGLPLADVAPAVTVMQPPARRKAQTAAKPAQSAAPVKPAGRTRKTTPAETKAKFAAPKTSKPAAAVAKTPTATAKKPATTAKITPASAKKPAAIAKTAPAKAAERATKKPAAVKKPTAAVKPRPTTAKPKASAPAEPEIGLVGKVRESGRVVEVNTGRVKATRTKPSEPSAPAPKKPSGRAKPPKP